MRQGELVSAEEHLLSTYSAPSQGINLLQITSGLKDYNTRAYANFEERP
jgi:hypothetical protein